MTRITTNYTTYDLAYYYADLQRLPRLSPEGRQQLIATLAHRTPVDTQARNRLIEDHLRLATHIAIDRCPPSYYRSLPDILGEVALTLVHATHRYDFGSEGDFKAYVAAWMDAAVKRTIEYDRLIRVPSIALWKARQQGTEEQLYALQPESLDQWMAWYDTSELEEPPVSPLLPTAAAPPRDLGLHAQVQTWLSYLSPRAQRVLTLHYGLSEEDERCYSIAEIAREMGLNRHTIHYIERDALKRIRALVEGTATIVEKDGVRHVKGIYRFRQPTLTPEDEALFRQAVLRLREEGRKVSTRVLAHATGKSQPRASAFLRLYRETLGLPSCKKATHEERMAQVAKSYAELETKGERITVKRLADMVHYSKETIAEYMRLRKQEQEEQDAAQAR